MFRSFLFAILTACMLACVPLSASPAPAKPAAAATTAPRRFSLALKAEKPRIAFTRIGEESGELVLVDSTVRGTVTADWKNVTAEDAVADACKQLHVSWKRIYLPPGTGATGDNVSQIYRNLRALRAGGLIALEPGSNRGTLFLLNTELPKDSRTVFETPNSGFRAAYLILNERVALLPEDIPADDGKPWQPGETLTPTKLARLQRDVYTALSGMSPDQRQAALLEAAKAQLDVLSANPQMMAQFMRESSAIQVQFFLKNPELMQGLMQNAMQTQIEMLQSMTPEQRQLFVKAQMDLVRRIPPEQMQKLTELMRGAAQ